MPISSLPPEDMVTLSASKRLTSFRLWFLILVILGLLAMLYVGYRAIFSESKPVDTPQSYKLLNLFTATVYAQGSGQTTDRSSTERSTELKQNIMVGIVLILALVLLMSLGAVFVAKDTNKVTVAGDILKTVLGFFIGVATTFFGS